MKESASSDWPVLLLLSVTVAALDRNRAESDDISKLRGPLLGVGDWGSKKRTDPSYVETKGPLIAHGCESGHEGNVEVMACIGEQDHCQDA